MENFAKFTIVLILMVLSPLINGFVIMQLWEWFIVPTFETDSLRLVEAVGLVLVIYYLKVRKRDKEGRKDFWDSLAESIAYLIATAGIALLSGWVVSLFM